MASSSTLGSGGAKSATSSPLYGGTGSSDHNPSNVLTPGMIGAPNSAFVRIGNDSNAMGSDPGTPGTSVQRVQPATPKEHDQTLATLQGFFGGNSQPGSAASNQEKLQKRVIEDHNCLNGQVTRKEFWLDPNAPKSVSIPSDQVINLGPSGPQEGINSALEGAVLGGFSDNDTYSSTGAQIVIGLIPIVGQVADVRDAIAAAKHVAEGKKGSTLEAIGAGIGFIPLVGDWAKGFLKGGKKAIKEGVEQGLKHGDDVAKAILKNEGENALGKLSKQGDNLTSKSVQKVLDSWELRNAVITARLKENLSQAIKQANLTPKQLADIAKNGRASTHWATQIDTRFKELVQNDPLLKGQVAVSPRSLPKGSGAPDVIDLQSKRWWDVTTTAEEFAKKTPNTGRSMAKEGPCSMPSRRESNRNHEKMGHARRFGVTASRHDSPSRPAGA